VLDPVNSGGGVAYNLQASHFNGNISSGLHNDNVVFENFRPEDFNAAVASTAIDFDPPSLDFDSSSPSASQSYIILAENDLNNWDLPGAPSDSLGDGFKNGLAFFGNLRPLNTNDGFVVPDFGLPTPWSPDTTMQGGFQQSVGSNVSTLLT
jgi:hypothetical protein